MSAADFLDSNVLIYLFDRSDARKRGIAEGLFRSAIEKGTGVISHQVVQEVLNVVTRKIKPALAADDTLAVLEHVLLPLWHVQPGAAMFAKGLELQQRLKLSFYDSLIVAAALQAKCKRLLSEDLQHGQRIDGLRIENPFKA